MNDKHRENTAKYLYDLSKVVFTFSVVANGVSKDFSLRTFWFGMAATLLLYFLAFLLDGGRKE